MQTQSTHVVIYIDETRGALVTRGFQAETLGEAKDWAAIHATVRRLNGEPELQIIKVLPIAAHITETRHWLG